MATERLSSLEQVRAFVEGSEGLDFVGSDRGSRNDFVRRLLVKFDYGTLGRADKGLAKRFLAKATGLSRAQLTRLIRQHAETGRIEDRRGGAPAKPFARRYAAVDAVLLAEVDETLGQVCGQATRAVMRREFEVFGDARFERLAGISTSHLYNLRKSRTYERQRVSRTRTKPTAAAIGERRKPRPEGVEPSVRAGLRAGGLRPPGRPRRTQGRLRDQPGRRPTACGRRSPSTSSWARPRPFRSAS